MMDWSLIHASPFYELTSLLMMATIVGYFCLLIRQPMIVDFIIVGILVGPDFLGIVQSHEHIELLAKLGIAVLLFLVGLKLDLHLIKCKRRNFILSVFSKKSESVHRTVSPQLSF